MTQNVGGSPRSLSRGQIQRVLRWHKALTRFRKQQGTLASFSKSLELTVTELRRAQQGRFDGLSLSFEQKKHIVRWKARQQRFKKRHPSAHQLAKSLGVSRSTLFLCIKKKGAYQTSVRGEYPRPRRPSPIEANAALLRAWGRNTTHSLTEADSATTLPTRRRGGV